MMKKLNEIFKVLCFFNVLAFFSIFSLVSYISHFKERNSIEETSMVFFGGLMFSVLLGVLPYKLMELASTEKGIEKLRRSNTEDKIEAIKFLVYFVLPPFVLAGTFVLLPLIFPKIYDYFMRFY